jgi:hypothetical protein
LCFALDSDDQKRTGFQYALSLFQMEYSRNFLFERGQVLEQVFQGLIDPYETNWYQIAPLKEGEYEFVAEVEGPKVDPIVVPFVRHIMPWERNQLGKSDVVWRLWRLWRILVQPLPASGFDCSPCC